MGADVLFKLEGHKLPIPKRFFGYEQIAQSLHGERIEATVVNVNDQLTDRGPVPQWLVDKKSSLELIRGYFSQSNIEKERPYLESQIESFLEINPEYRERIKNGTILDVLDFGLKITQAGTKDHDAQGNFNLISSCFDIDSPKDTKCNIFNSVFRLVTESVMANYRPDLAGQYLLVDTPAELSLDLIRVKNEQMNEAYKFVNHAFLTLLSVDSGGHLQYSSIDPYHARSGTKISDAVDFTEQRSGDSFLALSRLMMADHFIDGATHDIEVLNLINLFSEIDELDDIGRKGELAISLCSKWAKVRTEIGQARINFERYKAMMLESNERLQKGKADGVAGEELDAAKIHLRGLYSGGASSYLNMRFRYEFAETIENKFRSSIENSVHELITQIENSEEVNPRQAIILFDLMDSAGYYEVPISEEVQDEAIKFVRTQTTEQSEKWKRMVETETSATGKKGLFLRHYQNSGGQKPVEMTITKLDQRPIEVNSDYFKHIQFRAGVLNLMKELGVSDWKKFVPDETVEGTYARMLVDLIRE